LLAAVGVPLMVALPAEDVNCRPAGNAGLTDQVNGAVPPEVEQLAE